MKKDDLIRNLQAVLLKIERQNKTYGTGETRYDLMIKDVLNYIENSIPTKKIEDKIKEYEEKYNNCVNDVYKKPTAALIDFQRIIGAKEVLQELLEDK